MIDKETLKFVQKWGLKTSGLLKASAVKLDVKESGATQRSFASVTETKGDRINVSMIFEKQGRYVDMGVGKGVKAGSVRRGRNLGRKPKKFYSPVFYSRLNSLESGLGFQVMENALNNINDSLDGNKKG